MRFPSCSIQSLSGSDTKTKVATLRIMLLPPREQHPLRPLIFLLMLDLPLRRLKFKDTLDPVSRRTPLLTLPEVGVFEVRILDILFERPDVTVECS